MDYVISASYGNDSMAMMQWAHERGLQNVTVTYCDTGWAAPNWELRIAEGEALAVVGDVGHMELITGRIVRQGDVGLADGIVRLDLLQGLAHLGRDFRGLVLDLVVHEARVGELHLEREEDARLQAVEFRTGETEVQDRAGDARHGGQGQQDDRGMHRLL